MENTEESSVARRSSSTQSMDDPMAVHNFDNPRMILVTALLTDTNYLIWSRSIRRVLAAKNKLGYITDAITQPTDEANQNKWKRADEMVSSWIINSMSMEIAETFMYCTSARKLWLSWRNSSGKEMDNRYIKFIGKYHQ